MKKILRSLCGIAIVASCLTAVAKWETSPLTPQLTAPNSGEVAGELSDWSAIDISSSMPDSKGLWKRSNISPDKAASKSILNNPIGVANPLSVYVPENGLAFKGHVVYSSPNWYGAGMYGFSTASATPEPQFVDDPKLTASSSITGAYAAGFYYVVATDKDDKASYSYLRKFDTRTWKMIKEVAIPSDPAIVMLMFNPSDNKMYAYNKAGSAYYPIYYISVMDLDTGELSSNVRVNTTYPFASLVFSNDGTLYAISPGYNSSSLTKVDLTSTFNPVSTISSYLRLPDLTPVRPVQNMAMASVYDGGSNRIIFASYESATTVLFSIDPTKSEKSATKLGTMPDHNWIVGMYIDKDAPREGAPDKVSNLSITNEGHVSFDMPGQTVDGKDLNGALTYQLSQDNVPLVTDKAQANAHVEFDCTLGDGSHEYAVTVFYNGLQSAPAYYSIVTGYDAPGAVTSLVATYDNGKANLTWNAPTTGVNGGQISLDGITYNVKRMPEGEMVAEGISDTFYSEEIPQSTTASYVWYEVTSMYKDMEGGTAESNKFIPGFAYTLPYSNSFDTEEDFKQFITVDNDNDGWTWTWDGSDGTAKHVYSFKHGVDDWLITPPVALEADHVYRLKYKVRSAGTANNLEVKVGLGSSPASLDRTVVELSPISSTSFVNEEKTFVADKSGAFYVGFHTLNDCESYGLYIDDVVIEDVAALAAPAAVSGLQVTPAEQGVLSATISFTTPSVDVNGKALDGLEKVEVYRNDSSTPVKTFDNPALNTALPFVDDSAVQGENEWSVVAYNSEGPGLKASQKAWVGIGLPDAPKNVKVRQIDNQIHVSWDAPEGQNGSYVDKATLKYHVGLITDVGSKNVAVDLTDCEVVLPLPGATSSYTAKWGQTLALYAVMAESEAGRGSIGFDKTQLYGTPYSIPFVETMPSGLFSYAWAKEGTETWKVTYEGCSDPELVSDYNGDLGMLEFTPAGEGVVSKMYSGKITLSDVKKPLACYYTYWYPGADAKVELQVSADEGEFVTVQTVDLASLNLQFPTWVRVEAPLDNYKDNEYVQLALNVIPGKSTSCLLFDEISVVDDLDYNLALAITGPRRVIVGRERTFSVGVFNYGKLTASNYTIDIFNNDKYLRTLEPNSSVAPNAIDVVTFTESGSVDYENYCEYHAVVNFDKDENTSNNKSNTIGVEFVMPDFPTPENLKGEAADGVVELTWDNPDLTSREPETVVEDFEDYDSWIISGMDPWTMVDCDGKSTVALAGTLDYPNQFAPKSFMVFNFPTVSNIQQHLPHSGSQMLICSGVESGNNDDWLISPELTGDAQTISFYVKGITLDYGQETFEVLYSTTDKELESFTAINGTRGAMDYWQQCVVDLPEGTRYFAIRCTSKENVVLCIDDITYTPSAALELKGFNVVSAGAKNDKAFANGNRHEDSIVSTGEITYKVSAVYDKGESLYSTPLTLNLDLSGIVSPSDDSFSVTGGRGVIVINGASGTEVKIYTPDGRLVNSLAGNNAMTVKAASGVYIVKAGANTAKVSVK